MRAIPALACIPFALALMVSPGGCGSSGGGASAPSHPAVGHWLGMVERENGEPEHGGLLVEDAKGGMAVSLVLIPVGAFYDECIDVASTPDTLDFHFKKGRFDISFHATLSPDGREISGTFSAPEGSRPEFQSGSFQFTRTPRPTDLPGAMRFAATLPSDIGPYTPSIMLAQTDDGRWVGQFDVPERSLERLPMYNMRVEEGVIRGEVKVFGPQMEFYLTLSEDRQRLTGKWEGGGQTTELDLPRVD